MYWIRMLTGWLLFIGMIGIWFSPQPSLYYHILFLAEILNTEETLFIVVIKALGIVFLIVGAILGLSGVLALSIRTSGFHVKKELVTKNIYKYVRHPQYLGAILSHIGISLLTTELYSFLATPLVIALFYTMSIAEDKELESIFGEEFRKYKKMTGRFIPKFHYR
ncbi:MAG: isoprenylcysteine carboxylmethyltransferase family protein [Thermoprotei archaeon]